MTESTSILATIADAVKDELNGQAWAVDFKAIRQNIPRVKREEMSNLHVIVSPKSRAKDPKQRGIVTEYIEVYVGIQKGLTGDQNSESDPLIALGESISDYFDNGRQLAAYPNAPCVSATFGDGQDSPWMAMKDQDEGLLYTGVLVLEFTAIRKVS